MLVADDADDLAALQNRGIEHGRDTEWRQVRGAEFLRNRIAVPVNDSNDARALQQAEVDRKVAGVEDGAFVNVPSIGLVKVVATDRARLVDEEPDADSLQDRKSVV